MNDSLADSSRSTPKTSLRARLARAAGLCWIAASLATAAVPASAGDSAAAPGEGFAQLGGATTAVAVEARGDTRLAFVNIGPRVAVYDVSDPDAPRRLGQTGLLPEVSEGLAAEGGLLYVGTRRPGADDWYPLDTGPADGAALHVFDTLDPTAPRALATASLSALKVGAIALDRAYAYVLTDTGIAVVDVKNPNAPRQVAELLTPDPTGRLRPFAPGGIVVAGDFLLVARPEGFFVVDVREPDRPRRLDAAYRPGPAYGVVLLGKYKHALVAGVDGVDVVDVVDPLRPEVVRRVPLDAQPVAIAAEADRAVVLIGAGRQAVVLDASEPARPVPIATVALDPLDSEQTALALAGGRAFAALGRAGLRIIDVAAAIATAAPDAAPPEREARPPEAIVRSIEPIVPPLEHIDVAGDLIYAAAGAAGFFVLRVGEDGALRLVGALQPELPGPNGKLRRPAFHSVLHHAGLVYAHAEADGLWLIDVRDPASPRLAGPPVAIPGPRTAHAMARIGDHVFLPAADGTLHGLDIADPARPLPAGRLPRLGITNLIAHGEHLYATAAGAFNIGHLHVIDASRPTEPRYVRTVDFSVAFNRLAIGFDHLYLTGGFGELAVLDISQPAHPFQIDRQKGFDVGRVGVVDRRLIAAHPSWVETVDLAIPAFPRRRGVGTALPWGREEGSAASDVTVAGDRMIILRHQAGLFSLGAGDPDRAGQPYRPTAAALFFPWTAAIGSMPGESDAPAPALPPDRPLAPAPPNPADPATPAGPARSADPVDPLDSAGTRGNDGSPAFPTNRRAPCGASEAPSHVMLVIDTTARMAEPWQAGGPPRIESARTAARALGEHLAPRRIPVTLISLDRQARRQSAGSDAMGLAWALDAMSAVPVPPGAPSALRLDLGLVAATRGLGPSQGLPIVPGPSRGVEGAAGVPRVVALLVAGDADARTWALAAGRAGWLRARLGAWIEVFVLDPPGPEGLERWARLAGDVARVHPVLDPGALRDRVVALGGECGRS